MMWKKLCVVSKYKAVAAKETHYYYRGVSPSTTYNVDACSEGPWFLLVSTAKKRLHAFTLSLTCMIDTDLICWCTGGHEAKQPSLRHENNEQAQKIMSPALSPEGRNAPFS